MSAKRIQPEDSMSDAIMLAIRVSRPYKDLVGVFDRIKDSCDKYIVYQHGADGKTARDHVHALVVGCTVSTDTMKNWIKKELGVSAFPRNDWSFATQLQKKPVTKEFITYMSKGHLSPVMSNWDEAEVIYLRGMWTDEYRTKGMKRQYKIVHMITPQEAKKTYNQMLTEIHVRLGDDYTDNHILKTIVSYANEKQLIIGRYKVRDMFDTIRSRIKPDSYIQDLAQLCYFKSYDKV